MILGMKNVPFEIQIMSYRLIIYTNIYPLLFIKWETIYLHMPHKLLDITKMVLPAFGAAVEGLDLPLGLPTIKSVSRIHQVTNGIAGPMTDHGIADHYRVGVMHYLLDMG